jgi:hypothetical protein
MKAKRKRKREISFLVRDKRKKKPQNLKVCCVVSFLSFFCSSLVLVSACFCVRVCVGARLHVKALVLLCLFAFSPRVCAARQLASFLTVVLYVPKLHMYGLHTFLLHDIYSSGILLTLLLFARCRSRWYCLLLIFRLSFHIKTYTR